MVKNLLDTQLYIRLVYVRGASYTSYPTPVDPWDIPGRFVNVYASHTYPKVTMQ